MNLKTRDLLITLLATVLLSSCGLIYKQNVQQGNAHEQEDLDQIELGMSKKQVAYLLGTPAIHDPFHQDRWDYISMFSRRGGDPVRRLITLTFEDDILVATDGIGDSKGGDIKALEDTKAAVAEVADVTTAKDMRLITDDAVINWTLQLGAFGTQAEAEELAEKVREQGYTAKLDAQVVPGLGTRHQVRVGLYDTYNEAQEALRRIERVLDVAGITVPVDFAISTGFEHRNDAQPPEATSELEVDNLPEVEAPAPVSESPAIPVTEEAVPASDANETSSIEPAVVLEEAQDNTSTVVQPDVMAQDTPQYYVQVGSFSNPTNADALVARLSSFGLNAHTEELVSQDETIYKVRLGPEDSFAAAAELVRSLNADHDLEAFVIPVD